MPKRQPDQSWPSIYLRFNLSAPSWADGATTHWKGELTERLHTERVGSYSGTGAGRGQRPGIRERERTAYLDDVFVVFAAVLELLERGLHTVQEAVQVGKEDRDLIAAAAGVCQATAPGGAQARPLAASGVAAPLLGARAHRGHTASGKLGTAVRRAELRGVGRPFGPLATHFASSAQEIRNLCHGHKVCRMWFASRGGS